MQFCNFFSFYILKYLLLLWWWSYWGYMGIYTSFNHILICWWFSDCCFFKYMHKEYKFVKNTCWISNDNELLHRKLVTGCWLWCEDTSCQFQRSRKSCRYHKKNFRRWLVKATFFNMFLAHLGQQASVSYCHHCVPGVMPVVMFFFWVLQISPLKQLC